MQKYGSFYASLLIVVLGTWALLVQAQAPQVAPPVAPVAPAKKAVEHYASDGELIQTLPLTAAKPYRYWTIYSVKLPGLRKGDVILASSQFEITNDLGYIAMLAHAAVLCDRETIVKGAAQHPAGVTVCEYAGENVPPPTHHGFRTLASSFVVEQPGDAWLSVVVYAASTAAHPNDRLTVNQGYGGLRAVVLRN